MRKTLFNMLSACLLLIAHQSMAQSIETFDINKDEILVSIRNQLPKGWIMSIDSKTPLIEKKGPFIGKRVKPYIQDRHPNPAPRMSDSLHKKSIRFSLSDAQLKMNDAQRKDLMMKNFKIEHQLDSLYRKYGGKKIQSGKTEYHYSIKFPSEDKKQAYDIEKRELRKRQSTIPIYYSSTFCYGYLNQPYFNPDYKWSSDTIEKEVDQIKKILSDNLKQYTSD